MDVRCRLITLIGSEAGARRVFSTLRGVTGVLGDCLDDPVIFRANLLNGDMEPVMLEELGALEALGALGGVARYPPRECVVCPDVLDPPSLGAESPFRRSLRTDSISASVRDIRSRRFFHRCADSACLRSVSPFFVTRSRTPLSIIDKTLEVAGM